MSQLLDEPQDRLDRAPQPREVRIVSADENAPVVSRITSLPESTCSVIAPTLGMPASSEIPEPRTKTVVTRTRR